MIEYENLQKVNSSFRNEFLEKFNEILSTGWFVLGSNVSSFEKNFAAFVGTKQCIGVASGLDALSLSLKCLNFPKDAQIIVPSNTYIASILSILHNRLVPILVEPDIKTYNIDPKKIEEKINSKTKAIMVVHLYGKCCNMNSIQLIAKKYNLKIIEDCAQSHGAKFRDQVSGSFGDFGAHSFYPTKNLGALGDGGAITTNFDNYTEKIRKLRNYGSGTKYKNEYIGYNSRLDEIQAGFLDIKLKYINEINEHKRQLANLYLENLKDEFIKPVIDKEYYDVYHIFNIRHPKRDQLKEYLLKHYIKTEVHYPIAPHNQVALKNKIKGLYPISEEIHNTTLSLPISYSHSSDDIYNVIEKMNSF